MKKLFEGKRKLITIPLIGILSLAFLPIALGLGIGYLVYKKVGNSKLKYSLLIVIALFTLFFGSVWVSAMTSPNKGTTNQPAKQGAQLVSKIEEPQNTLTVSPSEPTLTPSPTTSSIKLQLAKVIKVVDGDTIEIEGGKKVRYIGIDTPETVDPRKPVQCFGKEASNKNKELIEGKEVKLEKDVSETDKYGRLLRYVYLGDTLINELLVKEGYAHASSYPPDIKYQDRFTRAEREARENNRGLWEACTAPTPTPTPKPTTTTQIQQTQPPSNGSYTCNCSKTCTEISSCAEAQYQLGVCGCKQRDTDKDGIACDGAPLNCQQ